MKHSVEAMGPDGLVVIGEYESFDKAKRAISKKRMKENSLNCIAIYAGTSLRACAWLMQDGKVRWKFTNEFS